MKIRRICTKRQHETNESAQRELAYVLTRGGQLEELRLYRCVICNGAWHVGHKNSLSLRRSLIPPFRPR